MAIAGFNQSTSRGSGSKGHSAAGTILNALGFPGRAVQNIIARPVREIVDALDGDPTTRFSIADLLTKGDTIGSLLNNQPWIASHTDPMDRMFVSTLSDFVLDPVNYIGVGLLNKPAVAVKAAEALNVGRELGTGMKALEAGADAAKVADTLNTVKGANTVANTLNEGADVAETVSRIGHRVNAKRIIADLLTTETVPVTERATEVGKLYRGGVASLAPETKAAIGYRPNLVFKIPFTESAIALPGTTKIGEAISVVGGKAFKGGWNALVTNIDPKYWIGEEAMTLRMAAKADMAESIPNGMTRYYQMPDGSWTPSKFQAVKNMTDVSGGLRVADVAESAVASSGWADKLADVSHLSDAEARSVLNGANIHRLEIPYELPKAFAAVQSRRLWRAIQAGEAGQILHDAILKGNEMYGIKDIRLALNQMGDLGAGVWANPDSKFRDAIVEALKSTHQRLTTHGAWRVPQQIADQWLEDSMKVLDEHAAYLRDLSSDPVKFAAERKKENIGIVAKLVDQGKKAGQLQAAIAVDGSIAKAAELSKGIIRTDMTANNADAVSALFDEMKAYGKARKLDLSGLPGEAEQAARKAAPKTVEQQIVDLINQAKKTAAGGKTVVDPTDVAARLLLGGSKGITPDQAKSLLENLGADKGLIDDLMRPFSGGQSAADVRKSIDVLIAKAAGNSENVAKIVSEGQTAEDAVRFWQHVLTNGWADLFDGSAPSEFLQGLLEGSRVDPADWLKLAEEPLLGDPSKLKPALGVTVRDENGAKQVIRVVRDAADIPDAVHAKTIADVASGMGGAKSPSEYAALKASEMISSRQAIRDVAQRTVDSLNPLIAEAEGRLVDSKDLAGYVDEHIRVAYQKYLKTAPQEPLMDWMLREIAPNYSKSTLNSKRGLDALKKGIESDLAILDGAESSSASLKALTKERDAAAKVLRETPEQISGSDLKTFEKRWTDAYDAHRPTVEKQLKRQFADHVEQITKNQQKMVQANQFKVQTLVDAQKEMVEKVLGRFQMKSMTASQKVADLASQQNTIQTELGQLLAMEQSLNNAAFAIGDQVDKFTAYLYRDIQAQHVDLLQRAQKLGVSLNTSGDADVLFMDAAMQIAQMNQDAAAQLLNFSTVGEGGNILMPKKMAEFITAKQHAGEFSKLTRLWRSAAILRPGFSNRNFIGAWFNNVAQGIRYGDYEASALLAAALKKNQDIGKLAAKYGVATSEIEEAFTVLVANSQLVGDMAHGLHSGTRLGNMLDRNQALFEQWSLARNGYLRKGNLFKLGAKEEGVAQAAREITVEDNVRLAQYLGLRRQGFSHEASMGQTLGTHFNYLDSSVLDARIRKYAPFWTYQSRNLGLQTQLMLSHPETTKLFWTAREDLRKNQGDNLPPWLAGFALPFGNTAVDLSGLVPAADLVRVGDFVSRFPSAPDKSVMALSSQFMGGPQFSAAQLLFNKDLFRGGTRIYGKQGESSAGAVAQYLLRSVGPVQQSVSLWDAIANSNGAIPAVYNTVNTLGLVPSKKDYLPQ